MVKIFNPPPKSSLSHYDVPMKTIILLITLMFLASCNDAMRTRLGKCRSSDNRAIQCATTDALTTENYRRMYIAQVTTPIIVGQRELILKREIHHADFDNEYVCDLDISANKQFTYTIEDEKLILRDGLATLTLSRTNGPSSAGLVGTWAMEVKKKNALDVTELIFNDLEELRIVKTCHLK